MKHAPRDAGGMQRWLLEFVKAPAFLAKYPYYAAVLARLVPVSDPAVSRMAVSHDAGKFYLHVNVDSFVSEPQFLAGILLHEVHHVVLGHLTDPRLRDVVDHDLMELALEMSANEFIDEPLPDPITWPLYASLGLKAHQSALERYEILASMRRQGAGPAAPASGPVDDHRPWDAQTPSSGASEHVRRLVNDAVEEVGASAVQPGMPFAKRPRLAGRDPARLVEQLSGVREAPTSPLDWRAVLRGFVSRTRTPVHTWSRPSRRFPHRVGQVPGRTYSLRSHERPHVLVAIDTSQSMSRAVLSEVARQLRSLSDLARLTIVECDAAITAVTPFTGELSTVRGRGGTDFRPVFDLGFLRAHDPDGVVYFTDGEGPAPAESPGVATLWVLTGTSEPPCAWGERVRLVDTR